MDQAGGWAIPDIMPNRRARSSATVRIARNSPTAYDCSIASLFEVFKRVMTQRGEDAFSPPHALTKRPLDAGRGSLHREALSRHLEGAIQ